MTIFRERIGVASDRLDRLEELANGKPWVFITEDADRNLFYFEVGGPGLDSSDDTAAFVDQALTRFNQLRPED